MDWLDLNISSPSLLSGILYVLHIECIEKEHKRFLRYLYFREWSVPSLLGKFKLVTLERRRRNVVIVVFEQNFKQFD